ncbi:hypothetical protein ACIQ9P_38905 [Kitasatospora sp. NPDC094019]|uniref:hypothetical protein n=1 Tax=Kitasatospora sp. NPDC094019 TaxID=3364091 RepID=UPI0037F2ACB6
MNPFGPPLLTLSDSGGCFCPRRREGGCIENLGLPAALLGQFMDGNGHVWTLLSRERVKDPVTDQIRRTTVLLSRNDTGRRVFKTVSCAGPPRVENRYEQSRSGRPPASARLPFQVKTAP